MTKKGEKALRQGLRKIYYQREEKIKEKLLRKIYNFSGLIYLLLKNDWIKGISITLIGGLILYFIIN